MSMGGALGGPMTAFQYDWNMLPIGQQLWLKHLLTYEKFPPLQAAEVLQPQSGVGAGQIASRRQRLTGHETLDRKRRAPNQAPASQQSKVC